MKNKFYKKAIKDAFLENINLIDLYFRKDGYRISFESKINDEFLFVDYFEKENIYQFGHHCKTINISGIYDGVSTFKKTIKKYKELGML